MKICNLILLHILFVPALPLTAIEKSDSSQIIFVVPTNDKTIGRMEFYAVQDGEWVEAKKSIQVKLGRSGVIPGELKREGDGGTPSGTFPIERIFGYNDARDIRLTYVKVRQTDYWIDDPSSKFYNQFVRKKVKASSNHPLLRKDEIYRLFIVVEHNTKNPVSGNGSMIFIHPWTDFNIPTSGCIGMGLESLAEIVKWLEPNKKPSIVILNNDWDQ